MSFVVVGLNHRTVPLPILERVTVPAAQIPKALADLAGRDHLTEVALLSTCNRTEVYAWCTKFHGSVADVTGFLAEQAGLTPESVSEHVYSFYEDAAITHLFGVAAGVDSVILGEGEILGQVREAIKVAEAEGTAQSSLIKVFRHAIEVGKRSRAETGISRGVVSISSAAVALAAETLGTLVDRRVLVVGAGEMGQGMARSLTGSGVGEVLVSGLGPERATEVAARFGGKSIPLEKLPEALLTADLILTSTGATDYVLDSETLELVMQRRFGRPLLIVDIAVPRDIDPTAADIDGITLLDMDDLKAFAEQSFDQRRREVQRVRRIIASELERFQADNTAREVAPVVAALRLKGEEIRLAELERFRSRLEALSEKDQETVEAVTRGIVAKLLHEPSVQAKKTAGSGRGRLYVDAISTLFDLEQ